MSITQLRKIRKERGISGVWLAQKLGIHRATLWNYEVGRAAPPTSVLFHVAHLLHIDPSQLTDAHQS